MDPYKHIGLARNADGTVTRNADPFSASTAVLSNNQSSPFLFKDIKSDNISVRIFRPRQFTGEGKLPLIVYYHGGGFVQCSPDVPIFHDFCSKMSIEIPAIIVSVKYRLAPEHRLPAAYEDAVEALRWVKKSEDDWLNELADLGNCYLMGSSAGGNIAYHVALRVAQTVVHLEPMVIRGLILHQPFFGGTVRTESELRLVSDRILSQPVNDLMWELSLPLGVDRDHEYCNPTVNGGSKLLDAIKSADWRVLITGCDGDPLIDRQIEVVKMMKEKGIKVEDHFTEGNYHGVEILEPSKAKPLFEMLKKFI